MELYQCLSPGCCEFSLRNTEPCSICGRQNWGKVDASSLTDDDWQEFLDSAESEASQFAVALAWAETDSLPGILALGDHYALGVGCQKDGSKAIAWWTKAAERKNPEAFSHMGLLYVTGDGIKQDVPKGLSLLWKAADGKDPAASCALGVFYDTGTYVKQDKKKAKKLFKLAADCGEPVGMFQYGLLLMERAKSINECETALSWIWRAAREDLPQAQLALGTLLSSDEEDSRDAEQSVYWLHCAAVKGCEGAASALAEQGLALVSLDEDIQEIFNLLYEALERGDFSAAKTLGDLYRDGIYVKKDLERAYKFYRQGQGSHLDCSARVAHCYRFGEGVEKNAALAFRIFTDIYNKGLENDGIPMDAILELADMYENGEGTRQNKNEAARLYSMAAASHHPRGMGQVGIFILEKHPFVKGTEEEALTLLTEASNRGDLHAALYLTKYYLAQGSSDKAKELMAHALMLEEIYQTNSAAALAKEYFPHLLDKEYCEDKDDGRDEAICQEEN